MPIFKKASVLPITRSVISQYDVLNPLYGRDPGSPMPSFEENLREYGLRLLVDLEGKYGMDAIPSMQVEQIIKKMAETAALLNSKRK